jgi:hypothetical protein
LNLAAMRELPRAIQKTTSQCGARICDRTVLLRGAGESLRY